MRYIKSAIAIAMAMVATGVFAAPYVTNVVAKQRFPWGIVDISCDVAGIDDKVKGFEFTINAVSVDSGEVRKASHVCFKGSKNGTAPQSLTAPTNGNYRFVWEANKDLDAARHNNMIIRVSIKEIMVRLWEGGPYWALRNIGAEKPHDYGYYFWWGDTIGYRRVKYNWTASDGSKSNFSFGSGDMSTYGSTSTLQSEGWITADGALAPVHDAAQAHWGGEWRMPTEVELENLNSKCAWTWTTTNGVSGYIVRGKDAYASASIFLPAAGRGDGILLYDAGSSGYYWSSVPYSGHNAYINAWGLYFNSGRYDVDGDYRDNGQSVRAVQGFSE